MQWRVRIWPLADVGDGQKRKIVSSLSMWRSRIAGICYCRYFSAHRGGHGSPLFVLAVAVVAGVDAVVVVVPSCAVFPFCWTGCFCYCL